MNDDAIENVHSLARKLNLPREWLIAEADAGRIPCLRVGRRRLFNIDAVRRVLAVRAGQGEHQEHPCAKVEGLQCAAS